MNNLCLLKNVMKFNSGARKFYCLMLGSKNIYNQKMLTYRIMEHLREMEHTFLKSVLSDECYRKGRKLTVSKCCRLQSWHHR